MSKYPKGLIKVARRVKKAAKSSERVIIFGDADLDGIASVVILKELLEYLNPLITDKELSVYFPNREIEGYGLTNKALDYLEQFAPALLFVLDSGITSFKEVERAKKLGFEVIVIDHHQVLGKLPKADLIVDPKQKKDRYPFKELAAAGLVYKLVEYLLSREIDLVKKRFLELAALATISDLMPLEKDNKEIVDKGLEALLNTQRPGILALVQLAGVDLSSELDISEKIIAPLNSFELKHHVAESYYLLTEGSLAKAKKLAHKLIRQRKQKKEAINFFIKELKREIQSKDKDKKAIVKHSKAWPSPYLGILSSKILKIFKKPVFLCKETAGEECICSARLPRGIDGVKAMGKCKKYLITYGGHAPACGCRLHLKDFDKFVSCLENYFLNLKKEDG